MRFRRWPSCAVAGAMTCLLFMLALSPAVAIGPSPAATDKFLAGNVITIPAGETIAHDLYVAGGTVRIEGRVDGDLFVAAGTITVTGPVSGNLFVAGGNITVTGPVNGDLFALGGTLLIASSVGKHLRIAGGDVTVSGPVAQDLLAAAGTLVLTSSARVGGDLIFNSGSMSLGADVQGSVLGSTQVYTRRGQIGGSEQVTLTQAREQKRRSPGPAEGVFDALRRYLSIAGVGALAILLVPGLANSAADRLRARPLPSLGTGVLAFISFFALVLAAVLATVIVTTPLGLLGFGALAWTVALGALLAIAALIFAFLVVLLFLAAAVVGLMIGRLVLQKVTEPWAQGPYAALLAGVLIVVVLTAVPVVGHLLEMAVLLFGLGALVLMFWQPHSSATTS